MTDDIADWYARRAEEASRLADELHEARETLRGLRAGRYTSRRLREYQESVVRTLERRLNQARYVGD